MRAGPLTRVSQPHRLRSAAVALLAGLTVALAGVLVASPGASAATAVDAWAGSGSSASASAKKRCRKVRVKLKRNDKVVKRNGKIVYRKVRRCKKPSRCRTVKVKKRTKNGKVIKRNGKPVYIKRKKCKPKPKPGPSPSDDLANRVLALAQHAPGNINLFTSKFPNGAQGLYPNGAGMAPATGTPPTEAQVRAQLSGYLNSYFGAGSPRIGEALAVYDSAAAKALIADPTLRAAFAAMNGTVLEPTIDYLLTSGKYISVGWGGLPSPATVANTSSGSTNKVITFNNRYEFESFEHLIPTMGHEVLHDDGSNPSAEEVIIKTLTAMTCLQVLSKSPELAHGGTELARQNNTPSFIFLNSKEAGSPNSEIYAPTGLGVAPGSPFNSPDLWTIFGGNSNSSPGSQPLHTILQNVFSPGTPIPNPLNFNQATAELFANLNDNWLSDVQRAQISVLLQLVTVGEIAQATGLGQQQIIDQLGLQPYLNAIK